MVFTEIIAGFFLILLSISAFFIVVQWKIFLKAGQPGWAVLVPFYNLYVYTQVIQRPKWWMALYFLWIVSFPFGFIAVFVIIILDTIRLAKVFGKNGEFAVGLIFLGIIFQPILAFGDAQYQHEGTAGGDSDLLDS